MKTPTQKDDAAVELGTTRRGVDNLVDQGVLAAVGDGVTRSSVERYKATRPHRFGLLSNACAQAVIFGDHTPLQRIMGANVEITTSERSGSDGGFGVPSSTADYILSPLFDGFDLPALCRRQVTPTNNYTVPVDRSAPHDPSSGMSAAFFEEAEAIEQSKISLGTVSSRLKKLSILVPVSEELLNDAPSLGAHVELAAREAILYKATEKILWGTGVGEPLGALNSNALITIDPEPSQTVDTINGTNIAKMFATLSASSIPTSVWLTHPDALAEIVGLTFNDQLIYTPGDAEAPTGRLLGRPIKPHEACETLGDLGDIILMDPGQYLLPHKEPAVSSATSLHMWFDRGLMAFKFTLRFDGLPMWSAPVMSRVGGKTRSPFVALKAR